MKASWKWLSGMLLAGGVLLPFVPLLLWSFSDRWFYPDLFPGCWGLRAWRYMAVTAGPQVTSALVRSLAISSATAMLSLAAGIPAGRVLGLYEFRGKDLVTVVLILPVIVPPLCVAMGLHLWFIRLGLAETFWGVVLVHLTFCLPYSVFVMRGVFSYYPAAFEDQARSLGASTVQTVTRVMLPTVWPGIVVAGLFSFLLSWSQYLSTLIIGGGEMTTLPILLFALMGSGDRPVAAAVSIAFVAPAVFALVFSSRYLGRSNLQGMH